MFFSFERMSRDSCHVIRDLVLLLCPFRIFAGVAFTSWFCFDTIGEVKRLLNLQHVELAPIYTFQRPDEAHKFF